MAAKTMTASGSRIAEIAGRWAAATPGPWAVGKSVHHDGHNIYASETQGDVTSPDAHLSLEDATAIAAAPADIAYLAELLTPDRLARALEQEFYAWLDREGSGTYLDRAIGVLAALDAAPPPSAAREGEALRLLRAWRDGALDGDAITLVDLIDETNTFLAASGEPEEKK